MTTITLAFALALAGQNSAAPATPICDECFAMKAYAAGLAEIATSQIALQKAESPEIKKFAEKMIADHTMVNDEIAAFASKKGIPLVTTLDPIHARVGQRLAALSGSDFDREYLKEQIGAHKAGLHLFGHEAHKGEDASLKALAAKTLPALQMHTKMAFELAGETAEYEKLVKIETYAKEVMHGSK